MRPHRLRMTAFGPFAGTEEIDLDALADGGLFLLHGETGAGKSSLLDAICFALYGTVPRAGHGGAQLRSHHAPPGVAPQVQLEVSCGNQRLRVTRSPDWERPKVRGSGTRKVNATVLLERLVEGGWATVSTRIDESATHLIAALGMNAEQFSQVVLLPQGEFARFLRADAAERGELLQRLFGTERFEQVEQWMAAERRRWEADLAAGETLIAELVARIAQAAATEAGEPAAEERAAWAQGLLAAARSASDEAAREVTRAQSEVDAARDGYDGWRVRLERSEERHRSRARRAELQGAQQSITEVRAQLAAARAAAAVVPLLEQLRRARQDLAQRAAREQQCRGSAGLPAPLPPLAELDSFLAAATDRVAALNALAPLDQRFRDHVAAAAAHQAEADRLAGQVDGLRDRLAGLPEQIADAEQQLAACRAAQEGLGARRAETSRLVAALRDAEELEHATSLVARHESARVSAVATEQRLRAAWLDARSAHLDGLAARLAAGLTPGDPCPVCGGVEHPRPAGRSGRQVDDSDVQAAEAAVAEAAAGTAELDRLLHGERLRAGGAEARLAEAGFAGAAPARIGALLDAATGEAAALQARAALIHEAGQNLTDLRQQAERLGAELSARTAEHAGQLARASTCRSQADEEAGELAAQLAGAADLAAAVTDAQRRRDALAELADAVRQRQDAEAALKAAREAAGQEAASAGFDSLELAAEAARDPSWCAAAEGRIREHDRAVALLDGRLAELGEDEMELAALQDAVRTAGDRLAAASDGLGAVQQAAGVHQQRAADLGRLVPQLEAAENELSPRAAQARTVRELAELVAGDGANHRRMPLAAYVLAARLEQVAQAASDRLLRMTDGRYTLLHTDGSADGRKRRRGLGLQVRDAWTGQVRETTSLSGGETFLASLALALGLADVVTAEAGGARIETLFVDEGFGTLDEQTLDEVLTVLDGLREGGRMVGIVSHVTELRQRIPVRLQVRKTPRGSTVEARTG